MEINVNKIKPDNNIFSNPVEKISKRNVNKKSSDNNISEHVSQEIGHAKQQETEPARINNYDSELMEDGAYKDLKDGALKMEFSISSLEKKLAKMNSEIELLEGLNSNVELNEIRFKRDLIETELNRTKKLYEKHSFSTFISSNLSKLLENKNNTNIFLTTAEFIHRNILSKCSKKYKNSIMIKDALSSLNDINKKVEAIVNTHTPYGEKEKKYDMLTAFLNEANVLHSKILSVKKK